MEHAVSVKKNQNLRFINAYSWEKHTAVGPDSEGVS